MSFMGYSAAVITVSDLGSRGQRVDTSGPAVRSMLEQAGYAPAAFPWSEEDRQALFGALYLLGRDERLQTLFEAGKEPKNAV